MDVDRYLALSTRDYNGMASDLAKASRSFGNDISDNALRRAFVGNIASFQTYKLDYAIRKAAAAFEIPRCACTASFNVRYQPAASATLRASDE